MKLQLPAIAFCLLPLGALAEPLVLNAPMAGGTYHSEQVDISAYWQQGVTGMDVTAIYAARDGSGETGILKMVMTDGDAVHFGLPGHSGELFTFARTGDALSVSHEKTPVQVALAD